ncbi:MAG: hypothetical protein LBH59_10580 [Planctomycetaceae bacterium]|nr:hypothetical protein [Planctomycetaceae bacterium]
MSIFVTKNKIHHRKIIIICCCHIIDIIPKPVWAVGFALEQTLHVVAFTVFSYVDFKVASAYLASNFNLYLVDDLLFLLYSLTT